MKKVSNFALGFGLCGLILIGVAASANRIYTESPSLVETGSCVSASTGLATNIFTTAFSATPKVAFSQVGSVVTSSNILVAVTASQIVINNGASGMTNNFIAIGTP